MSLEAANGSVTDVVARAVSGEEAAFRAIVEAHASDMRQVAFVVTGDLDLATDAVANAWPIAWRKLRSLREPDALRSWLVAIAANEARRLARKRQARWLREISIDTGDGVRDGMTGRRAGTAASPDEGIDAIDLARALTHLSPDDRALLALRYVAGMTSTELAHATGLTASGTRARLARLLDQMRLELRDA